MLIDGPASWRRRIAMIEGAKERISCLSWAFYDDTTGWDAARRLVAAAQRGVQVRVCVDAQVAEGATYAAPVRWMLEQEKASGALPLEVVAWRDPVRPFDGQHRKILVVDGRSAVLGGMNFGDAYSHLPRSAEFEAKATAPAGPGWRDTDVHVGGAAAVEAERVFARVWNGQIASRGLRTPPMPAPTAPARAEAASGGVRAAVIEQLPGRDERILLSWLTAIDAATTSVEVTNAYLVRIPSVQAALLSAAKRGVRVRVLTNSLESLDEPILATAILTTVGELADGGVEVHLRKGSTLHAKTLVVDDTFSSVGSFNLHPALGAARGRGDGQPPRRAPGRRPAGRVRARPPRRHSGPFLPRPGPPRRPPRPPGLPLLPRPPLTPRQPLGVRHQLADFDHPGGGAPGPQAANVCQTPVGWLGASRLRSAWRQPCEPTPPGAPRDAESGPPAATWCQTPIG